MTKECEKRKSLYRIFAESKTSVNESNVTLFSMVVFHWGKLHERDKPMALFARNMYYMLSLIMAKNLPSHSMGIRVLLESTKAAEHQQSYQI